MRSYMMWEIGKRECVVTGSLSAAFAALRRRAIIPAITGAILALTACAAPSPPNAADDRNSRLWQVEKDGYARSSVFGTSHSPDTRRRTPRREVPSALAASPLPAFHTLPSPGDAAPIELHP